MSNNWDCYLRHVDGRPASILVNLGLASQAPLPAYPCVGHLRIQLRYPGSEGLSRREEFDDLAAIEDAVNKSVAADGEAIYVGRITANGVRDLYFYTTGPDPFTSTVREAMERFPAYTSEIATRPDQEWTTFRTSLYPSDEELQQLSNRHVCQQLQNNGDQLDQPRKIDHFAYFATQEGQADFAARIETLGFGVARTDSSPDAKGQYGVAFFREDQPAEIDAVTLPLFHLAQETGGQYDGWGCPIVRTSHNQSDQDPSAGGWLRSLKQRLLR